MPKTSRLEVIETGARRRWTQEEKLRIVAEGLSVRRNVSATARRYGLSTGQLFTWCRLARSGKLIEADDGASFVPAIIAPDEAASDAPVGAPPVPSPIEAPERTHSGRMVIVLSGTRRVIVGSDVDAAALRRVLDVLERS